jgi:predicted nucleic acid-binding protein
VAQELLQGVAPGPAFDRLERYLASQLRLEPVDPWLSAVEAARMFGACRAAGVTVRSTLDCLIARIAIEHGVALLHDDRDFDAIARVVPELRMA